MTVTLQITSAVIKPWEHVWRTEEDERGRVQYRVFNRGTWHDQWVTRALEDSWKLDELLRFILQCSRQGTFRLKTAGPKGWLP